MAIRKKKLNTKEEEKKLIIRAIQLLKEDYERLEDAPPPVQGITILLCSVNIFCSVSSKPFSFLCPLEIVTKDQSYKHEMQTVSVFLCIYFILLALKIISYHHGHISAILALVLSVASYWQGGKNFSSTLEFGFVAILYFFGVELTFPVFQVMKMVVSFLFFIWEVRLHDSENTSRLRYIIGLKRFPWQSCHAAIAIDNEVYHYAFENGHANTQESSWDLVPQKVSNSEWIGRAMFAPCVGWAVKYQEEQVMQKLEACGKCHDWAVVSLYLLSYDKFLTYSVLTPLRWTTWITLAVSIGISVFQVPSIYKLYIITDSLHLLLTLVDVLNLSEERLDMNDAASSVLNRNRGYWRDIGKLFALGLLCYAATVFKFDLARMGFPLLVGSSSILCFFVHLILTKTARTKLD